MQTSKDLKFLIATKGRAGKCKLLTWLNDSECAKETTLFVEEHELDNYYFHYPNFNFVFIRERDKGLAYVRNMIWSYAIAHDINYFWMPDDDITGFFDRVGNRMVKAENWIQRLRDTQRDFIDCKFHHAGLEYQQFAWSATKPFVIGSFVDAVVWFNMPLLKQIFPAEPPYREELKLKVDRDFCMQVIAYGGQTSRSTTFALSMPKEGSNTGGLKEIAYDITDLEYNMVCLLQKLWGEHVVEHITKSDGRRDAKIHWNKIKIPKPINNNMYDGLF